jgi:predicted DNA-binding WGR domain protein
VKQERYDVELRRIDAAANMRKFYRVRITPPLPHSEGPWVVRREWGRLGVKGPKSNVTAESFDTWSAAKESFEATVSALDLRGYVIHTQVLNDPSAVKAAKSEALPEGAHIESSADDASWEETAKTRQEEAEW